MRILQLCANCDPHIVGLYQRTADALQAGGHSVSTAFLTGPSEPSVADEFGSDVEFFDLAVRRYGSAPGSWVQRVSVYCHAQDIELVIAQRHRACAIAARIGRRHAPRRRVVVYHGLGQFRRWRRRLFAAAYLRQWTVVGVSEALRQDLLASRCGFRSEQVVAIPNAIDVTRVQAEQVDRAAARQALGIAPQAFVFGTVGRLCPSKGQRFLVQAFASVATALTDGQLAIFGSGSMAEELVQLARRQGIGERTHLLGHVPQAHRYLSALDAFVLPSLEESFGLALLEAMAARLPVIATLAGGIPEVVGDTGELVPSGDEAALADAMVRTYRMPYEGRHNAGERACRRVRARFDLPHYYTAYQDLVRRMPE